MENRQVIVHQGGMGIGLLGFLGLLFVTLKLTGVINWSWWFVTLPFWFGFAVVFCIIVVILFLWSLYALLETLLK